MANIIEFGELSINGDIIATTQETATRDGCPKRDTITQMNGPNVTTLDNTPNFSEIEVTVLDSMESRVIFDALYDNGTNNVITYNGKNYSGAKLVDKPQRKIMGEATYMFHANPPA